MDRLYLKIFCAGWLWLSVVVLTAEAVEETLSVAEAELAVGLRRTAIPDMGETRLGKILDRYYLKALGGAEHWEEIISLRVSGRMLLAGGELECHAYQRKPDMMKVRLLGNDQDVVLGYDGQTAWHNLSAKNEGVSPMGGAEARRFIHSATFGNYLLYPYAEGKTITYVDTLPLEGVICHHVRVTLESDYQVDYFINVRTYLEAQVEHTDLRTGDQYMLEYEDYSGNDGIPIAKKVVSSENGEWVSTLEIDEIRVNSGVMPWMFQMPD